MSNVVVALLFAIGLGGWVFAKLSRSTGGNKQSAVIGAGVSGVVIFILALILLNRFVS